MTDMNAFRLAGVAAALTAGACFYSGRSVGESIGCGLGVGVVTGAAAKLAFGESSSIALPNLSKFDIEHGYGALKPPALNLLSKVNSDVLFAPRQFGGWVIGSVPPNEYEVRQLP